MSANEIDKVSLASKNESLPVDQRITGVREWLRLSDYSARSCIIARRIAKKILRDYKANAATWEMSQKAERLLNFVEKGVKEKSRPAQENQSVAAPVTAVVPQPAPLPLKRSVEELNLGWDHPQIPKKFIEYYEPEDLPAFGVPADSAFKWTRERNDTIVEVVTDSGVYYAYIGWIVYFVLQGQRIGSHGPLTCRILNPKYVSAYEGWKSQRPRESNAIFAEELDLMTRVVVASSGYRVPRDMECKNPCNAPCDMRFIPNVTYEVEGVSNANTGTN